MYVGWANGFSTDIERLMPPISSFRQQHIIRIDLYHGDIVDRTAFFEQAVVDNHKTFGGFRCPHQRLQFNPIILSELFCIIRLFFL